VGAVIGALVAAERLDLARMAAAVAKAEDPDDAAPPGEETELVSGGGALDVVAACLRQLEAEKGGPAMAAAWQATGLDILSFAPSVRPPWEPAARQGAWGAALQASHDARRLRRAV